MSNNPRSLGWLDAGGTPREIGKTLGQAGRAAVHQHLLPSGIWQTVTAAEHAPRLARMIAAVSARFPAIREEIEGLAEGLDLPFDQVFAWNARGDLLASAPDGCTTVQIPGAPHVIAHNEDGLPFFRGSCFIAAIAPDGAPGFRAFCYPGSIPGHTFAETDAGLVQAVNNMRLLAVEAEIPRMVLGRAVMAARSLDEALDILRENCSSGGFNFTLAQTGDPRLISVEFGGGETHIRSLTAPALHANHALHLPGGVAHQIITGSSRDRQARGDTLVAEAAATPLEILRDTGGGGLPIRRDAPDDPDCENTLATAVFHIGETSVKWSIYDSISGEPAYASPQGTA